MVREEEMLHCSNDVEAYHGSVEWHADFNCLCRSTNELEGVLLTPSISQSYCCAIIHLLNQSMRVHDLLLTCEPGDMTTSRRIRSSLSGSAMLSPIVSAQSWIIAPDLVCKVGSKGITLLILRSSETRSGPGYFAAV